MAELLVEILDVATGVEEIRPANAEELAQFAKDKKEFEDRKLKEKADEALAAKKRESALAKLEALGLELDDLKALGF